MTEGEPTSRGPSARGRGSRVGLAELAAWRSFIETSTALKDHLDRRLQADSGLSGSDFPVLLALVEADGSCFRASELADHIRWERSRLSHHVARMEKRGLVRRAPHAEDNRGSEVHLTTLGADTFRAATGPHMRAVRELFFDALSAEQQAALADAMGALHARLEAEPPPGPC